MYIYIYIYIYLCEIVKLKYEIFLQFYIVSLENPGPVYNIYM